jgi:hypothetical protein
MRVILLTWCQIQRRSPSFRCVNCGPRTYTMHLQFLILRPQYSTAGMLLQIFRHIDARYTANLGSNTAHILQFTLYELWFRTYTMHLQLNIFRLQYSFERICAAIGDISTTQCALYSKLCAKYSSHPTVYAVGTVAPDIYNVITAPHMEASIFD